MRGVGTLSALFCSLCHVHVLRVQTTRNQQGSVWGNPEMECKLKHVSLAVFQMNRTITVKGGRQRTNPDNLEHSTYIMGPQAKDRKNCSLLRRLSSFQ